MTNRIELSHQTELAIASDKRAEAPTASHVDHASDLAPADSIGERWPADLTRRLRVLLHTLPLNGLRRSDAIRDAEFRHYDSLALALRVLDAVVDRL